MAVEEDQALGAGGGLTVQPQPRTPTRGPGSRLSKTLGRVPPDAWALAAIAVAVVLGNLPYLLGWFDPVPLHSRSELASSIVPGLINGRPTIDPNVGFSSQAIGHLAALDLLHLHLPWWNPYEATGMPLLGETQSAALFPPTLLTALSGGVLYERMLLEMIAGFSTYLLLRRIPVVRAAAASGGAAFALSGTFAWLAHAAVNPVAFLPLLLLGIERAYTAAGAGRPGGWRLIALAGALSVYAGFPEVAYINALMAVCWLAWRCGCLKRSRRRTLVAKAALGVAAGALLAAPMLVAMGGYLSHAYLGVHADTHLGGEHLPANGLAQLLMPYLLGQVNSDPRTELWQMVGGYLSTSLVLLAVVGSLARDRRGLRLMLLGWGLLVFARMYGEPPLLGHALGVLPDMSRVAFFRYATSALELSVIALAALGLNDLARVPEHRRRLAWAAAAVLVVTAAAALAVWPFVRSLGPGFHHVAYFGASVAWGASVGVVAAGLALLRNARVRVSLLAALVAADALALFVLPELSAPRADTVDLAPAAYLHLHLGESRFFTLGPIQPNYGSYFELAELNLNDFAPKTYARYVHTRLDPVVNPGLFVGNLGGWRPARAPSPAQELSRHLSGYRAAAVRYVLAPAGQPLPRGPHGFHLVLRTPTTWIYQLAGSSAYFGAPGCQIHSSGRQRAAVSCLQPVTLVRRETWFPGWSARVDGRPAPIRRVDGLFQGVAVPAGSHRVTFSFTPPGIGWAGLAALAGCALMCAPALARRRADRGPAPRAAG